jgi:hypothetical protein
METKRSLLAALVAGGITVAAAGAAIAQGMQGGMGPGMMQGNMGPGMMGPGMGPCMMQGGMGAGMMGPGMMQGGMGPDMMMGSGMGPGMMQGGMGPGMMMGSGMMQGGMGSGTGALFGSRVTPMMNLSVEDVRSYLAVQLERLNNKRLKVGDVAAADGTITADIVTVDNSLVQRLKVDRRSGAIEYQN